MSAGAAERALLAAMTSAIVLGAELLPGDALSDGLGDDGLGLALLLSGVGVGLCGGGLVGLAGGVVTGFGVWPGAVDGLQLGAGLTLAVGAGEPCEGCGLWMSQMRRIGPIRTSGTGDRGNFSP